jgi:hypothetical protein
VSKDEQHFFSSKRFIDNHHSFLIQVGIICIPEWLHDEGSIDILKRWTMSVTIKKVVSGSQLRAWLIIVVFDYISF